MPDSARHRFVTTDIELLSAWTAGDERAGERLILYHYGAIERFFLSKAHDDASDLIQRTFLELLENRAKIEVRAGDGRDVRRYLFGIARNILLEHLRRGPKRGECIDITARSVADLSPGADTWIAMSQRSDQLLEALRQIPLESQLILELYYWEDLRARELAELLGVPEGSVRTKIRRAKQQLERERLARSSRKLHETLSNLDSWARQVREHLGERSPA